MIEVRFHGRGGQGAKTAADLLAHAALQSGKFVQSFPEYGPERAGAPMKSFVRIDNQPITLHCGVTKPNIVVVIDPTLLTIENVTEGISKDAILIVNTQDTPESIRNKINFFDGEVSTVDATQIALQEIGQPLPNTPMLAALVKVTQIVSLDQLKEEFKNKFGKKLSQEKLSGNLKAIDRAYNEVRSD
ncbi:MAG: 2-oxoacid:acceptor oxidoreductase family protein [Elusimicrobiota bacterium]|nr:2-oxoacid:acceptor oxidoreductase family protein [Elusimicrobiota bacterium]